MLFGVTEREKAEREAKKAIAEFVATGKWPKPGTLPVCIRFPRHLS